MLPHGRTQTSPQTSPSSTRTRTALRPQGGRCDAGGPLRCWLHLNTDLCVLLLLVSSFTFPKSFFRIRFSFAFLMKTKTLRTVPAAAQGLGWIREGSGGFEWIFGITRTGSGGDGFLYERVTPWDLIFGNGIKVSVQPEGPFQKPTLFILRPLTLNGTTDVCLAADFRPKDGEMIVNGQKSSTRGAVLSNTQKSFFFAGFQKNIKDCELHNSSITGDQGGDTDQDEDQDTNEESWTDSGRENLLLLQMNMLRVILTKTVSLSTIITIRALLL